MCGIAAIFAYGTRSNQIELAQLSRMSDRMACRGPDGSGSWHNADRRVALAHRRLAIIDLSDRGAQPMKSHDAASVISFNGEIYNFRELKRELERSGCSFHSNSDTEVLLRLYEQRGEEMVQVLRGMYAFVLWDGRKGGLFLARDQFGIKPLYYADDGQTFRAASEVKALLASGGVDSSSEPAGHVGFFLWGHVPEPYTLYRGIRALPAGSTLWVDRAGPDKVRTYADVRQMLADAEAKSLKITDEEGLELVSASLRESVEHHLVSDVDVGVFLSAGIDSNSLLALATESHGQMRTVTLGFEQFRGTPQDETPLAEATARLYGAKHQTIWISRRDFAGQQATLLDRMDQPSIDGANSYFVARAASQAGLKVALSGLGGDELFGGYPSFRQIPRLVSTLKWMPASRSVGRPLRRLLAPLLRHFTSTKYAGVVEYGANYPGAYLLRRALFLPWELTNFLDADVVCNGLAELQLESRLNASIEGISSNRLKVTSLEAAWYMRNQLLRDTDWASMSHSLEVRVPLVDWTLWRQVAPVLSAAPSLGKAIMTAVPKTPLPDIIRTRPKTGFGFPTAEWIDTARGFERGLRSWAHYVYRAVAPGGFDTTTAAA